MAPLKSAVGPSSKSSGVTSSHSTTLKRKAGASAGAPAKKQTSLGSWLQQSTPSAVADHVSDRLGSSTVSPYAPIESDAAPTERASLHEASDASLTVSTPTQSGASRVDQVDLEAAFADVPGTAFEQLSESDSLNTSSAVATQRDLDDNEFGGGVDDALMLAALDSSVSNVLTASEPLTLFLLVLHSLTVFYSFVRKKWATVPAFFNMLQPQEFARIIIAGIPCAAVQYLDECLLKLQPWDLLHLATLLHPLESCAYRHGTYLILLCSDILRSYGGSAASSQRQFMLSRVRDHLSEAYRKAREDKILYQAWASKQHPVREVITKGFCLLPPGFVAKYGQQTVLFVETFEISFFCNWFWNGPGFKVGLNGIYPEKLLQSFKSVSGSTVSDSDIGRIMRDALGHAAGLPVWATNYSVPLCEHQVKKLAAARLLEGDVEARINTFSDESRCPEHSLYLSTHCVFQLGDARVQAMMADGFSFDRPVVTLKLEMSEEASPDCWAQVQPIPPTEANPLGFEDAARILLTCTFIGEDNMPHTTYIHRVTDNGSCNALERACDAMTFWEYANGTLPGDDFGRRRRNLAVPKRDAEQGTKAWHAGQPELLSVIPLVAGDEQIYECKNPDCMKRFSDLSNMLNHYRLSTKGERRSSSTNPERAAECRRKAGITTYADATPSQFLAPGVDESRFGEKPMKYKCLGDCGQRLQGYAALKDHLFRHSGPRSPTPRQLRCRKACGVSSKEELTKAIESRFKIS